MLLVVNLRISSSSRNPRSVIFGISTMSWPSSTKVVTEYARSCRSFCRKCSKIIDLKSLRLGLKNRNPLGYESYLWYHFNCLPLDSISISSANTIEGFSELTDSDQDKLKQLMSQDDQSSTNRKGDADVESNKRGSKKQKVNEDEETGNATNEKILAEYAKSGKTSCEKCAEKIDYKSLRLGLNSWDPRGFESTKLYHLDCFFSIEVNLLSPESIKGFSKLKSSDQEKIKTLVRLQTDEGKKNATNEKILAEYAKSGKTSCEKCAEKIDYKSLRLGLNSWDPRGFENTKLYHLDCFFSLDVNLLSPDSIKGFSKLKSSDQEKIKTLVHLQTDEGKKNATNEKILAEYTKSGRSSCKRCGEKFVSKSLRLGSSIWDPRGFENTKWYHLHCFFPQDSNLLSPESIQGFSELKSSDQEKLKKLVTERDQSSNKTCDSLGSKINFVDSDVKDNYKGATLDPRWKVFRTLIYLEREDGLRDSSKIAAFDFDGCLAKTSVERVGANAWSLMYASIPKKLQSLYNDGFKLVIFTNESSIEHWKKRQVAVDSKIGRLNNFISLVNVPIQVFIACGVIKGQEPDPFRKPQTGMWRIMEQHFNSGIPIDMDRSFYVGDAAGRINDHRDANKKFAKAIGLKFHLPEVYFDQ